MTQLRDFKTITNYTGTSSDYTLQPNELLMVDLTTPDASLSVHFIPGVQGSICAVQLVVPSAGRTVDFVGADVFAPDSLRNANDGYVFAWVEDGANGYWNQVGTMGAGFNPTTYYTEVTSQTTSSTSFAQLAGLSVDNNLAFVDQVLQIDAIFNGTLSIAGAARQGIAFEVQVDGSPVGADQTITIQNQGDDTQWAYIARLTGIATGPHTVSLQWRVLDEGNEATANVAQLRAFLTAG